MDEKERLNALEGALNNETREREFYLRHAGQAKTPSANCKQILIAVNSGRK